MKLKEKLDLMRSKTKDDIDYGDFSKIVENKFLSQLPSDIKNGSRVQINYIEGCIDFKKQKVLYIAFLKSKNKLSIIGESKAIYEKTKFMKQISWDKLKRWCKNFCLEQGFEEPEILEKSHSILIIYTF